ncbi:MAG: hypothetical protein ABIR70_18395 [Bryobacteraceae bacterium]
MDRLRIVVWSVALALGVVVAARWVWGPFSIAGVPVNVPLNPEGVFGLLLTLLLAEKTPALSRDHKGADRRWLLLLAPFTILTLWPALNVGFLSDDFILIKQARDFSMSTLGPLFTTAGGDGFFRPLGYLSFDLNALVSDDPRWWHLSALLLHAANAVLVAMLGARLGASRSVALLAGALFALHGTHLEAAVWIAGRFDLLAALFTLATLLLFGRSTAAALVCALAALWSKEAAFVLPALVTLLAWHERKLLRSSLPFWAITAAAFLYRWLLLGGIGGYTAESGGSAFFSLKFATTAKAVFVRVWTSLYFPLNWSREPSMLVGLLACVYIGTLLWLAWKCRPTAALRLALIGLAISILPPLHLLGGAADLSGGRLLYLPSIWFCLLLAFATANMERRTTVIVTVALLAFHLAALHHDLPFWQRAGEQVRAICQQPTTPPELPRAIEGVPALANGFAECIEAVHR